MTIPRDRWGRPLVPADPFPTGEPVWHHRPSSIGNIIADTYNLQRWQKRMLVKGACARPDLLALADSADPDTDKRQLNDLCDQLVEAAAASAGANTGTALHAYTEQLDQGIDPQPLERFKGDLDAYRRCLDGHGIEIIPELSERFVVWPAMRVAGSCDRYVKWQGRLVALDLKTGKHNPADFSMVQYAAQLACYAHASHMWDGVTAEPLGNVDPDIGLILWLPAGQARAELVEVDLKAGVKAVELATTIHAFRRRKDLGRTLPAPVDSGNWSSTLREPDPGVADAPDPARASGGISGPRRLTHDLSQRIGALRARLATLTDTTDCTVKDVLESWPADAPPLTAPQNDHSDDSLDRIEGMVVLLETAYGDPDAPQATVDAMIVRLQELPIDLFERCQTEAKALEPPIPNLRAGTPTVGDMRRLDAIVERAEQQGADRLEQVVNALSTLPDKDGDAIAAYATELRETPLATAGIPALKTLTDLEAEAVCALAELYRNAPADLEDWMLLKVGSRSRALAAGKRAAERHGLPKPISCAEILNDRLLTALTTATAKETDK